jgi:sugar lactone lactonase YvrE
VEWPTAAVILLASLMVGCSASPGPHQTSPLGSPSATAPAFSGFVDPVGIAFDAQGEAWVADYRLDSLSAFPSPGLAAHGRARLEPSATVISVGGPNQLRFDAHGMLWVAGWDQGEIRGYAPGNLRSASARPTVTISEPSLNQPTDIAFDRTGTMWVANQASGKIVAFGADQIRSSGSPKPRVVLQLPGFGTNTPEALAFDRSGRLWISSY